MTTRIYPESLLTPLGISHDAMEARGLREYAEAVTLEWVETGHDGRQYRLSPPAATAWRAMKSAAAADGIPIFLASAFRSVERQVQIIRKKLFQGMDINEILTLCAAPGYSEHHTGCAVDICTTDSPELEEVFETTPAFAWLIVHAARFGFTLSYPRGNRDGYAYEPWHWCFRETSIEPPAVTQASTAE